MRKLINDTLKRPSGRYCHKRIASFSAFWVAVFYMTIPIWKPSFNVEVLIVTSLLAFSAAAMGIRLYEDKFAQQYNYNDNQYNDNDNTTRYTNGS